MDFYNNNMKYLKRNQSNLYEKIYNAAEMVTINAVDQVDKTAANNGENILLIENREKKYRMNSCYNPTHEASIWAGQFVLNKLNTMISMFGFGNGLFATKIADKLNKEDYLFIYEPSYMIFDFSLHHFDLSELLKKRNVLIMVEGLNEFDFHMVLQNTVTITNMFSQIQCVHPYYEEIFEESYLNFWKEIRDKMVYIQTSVNTEIKFGEVAVTNCLKNLKYLKDSNTLTDFFPDINRDIPAILVAAGPSVKENLEELKKAKGRAYLFVVDRILDFILDNGIEPDFVVTVDPMKRIADFSKRDNITIPLLADISCNTKIMEMHKGKKIFYNGNEFSSFMYREAGVNPPSLALGASVATAAFSACIALGIKNIAFVGQDLAYDGDFTHAGGVAEKFDYVKDIYVEGIDGEKVRSRYDWYQFIQWFNDMIALYPDYNFIDTKSKGAKITGTIQMPLSEVMNNYGALQPIPIRQIVDEKPSSFDDEKFEKVEKFLSDSCKEMRYLKKKAKEAIDLCDRQISEYNENPNGSDITRTIFKKISRINRALNKKPTYSLLDGFITALTAKHMATLYEINEDDLMDKIETYNKSKIIYQAIIDAVNFTLPKMKDTIKILDQELEEST